MNYEERPDTIGSSGSPTTPKLMATNLPCRKTLFHKQSPLMRFAENFEGCGNPTIKAACGCNGQNWITNRSPHHAHLCPSRIVDRSRHCSRNRSQESERHQHHQSGGLNWTDEDVSKLIIEEDLLDVIFFNCDTDKTGNVSVSALIESICAIMLPSHLEETQAIDELTALMDPSGKDARVDLLTYRNTMTRWIHILQPDRCLQMDESLDLRTAMPIQQSTPCSDTKEPVWRQREDLSHSHLGSEDMTGISFGSLEGLGGEMSKGDIDTTDLQAKIDDLEFQVKNWREQYSKLQKQMESTEETNAQLITESDQLKMNLKSKQYVAVRNTSIREENEELKSLVSTTDEEKKLIQRKCSQIEKDRNSLEVKTRNLQDELEQAMSQSESMQQNVVKLEVELKEYKKLCQQAALELNSKKMALDTTTKTNVEMRSTLKDLHNFNMALKAEKTELECKVAELKQDLCILQQGQSPAIAVATCAVPILYDKCSDNGQPVTSLHSELSQLVLADESLPSPICGTIIDDTSTSDATSDMPKLDPNSLTECMLKEFRQQKDDMQERIDKLLQQVTVMRENKDNNGFSSDLIAKELQSDMNSLLTSMTKLVDAKKSSDLRNAKLTNIIKKLRDKNASTARMYEESQRLVDNLSSGEQELEKVREENESLQQSIQNLKASVNDLEIKLTKCRSELKTVKEEAHTLTSTLQTQMECRDLVEKQLQKLKRSYTELEVRENHSQNMIKHLKTDILTKETLIESLQEEQRYLMDAKGDLDSTRGSPHTQSSKVDGSNAQKSYNAEETGLAAAQKAANAMAQSYARPNMLMQHMKVSKEEPNNNGNDFLRQRSASLTARKPSHTVERRHSDQDRPYLTSKGSSGQLIDLVNDKLPEVAMSPEDIRYNTQLLSEARQASDRFRNRRGRQWSIDSLSSNGDRSPGHSGSSSPRDRSPAADRRRSSSDTSTSSISQTHGSEEETVRDDERTSPLENLDSIEKEESMEQVGERTGAEGESDTEENKSTSCRPRTDSDLEDIDIKADILKNIGPLQTEHGRSKEPMAKRREEQKLKRNVSFKMPQLSEAQEVNSVKEPNTTETTPESVTQDATITSTHQKDEDAAAPTAAEPLSPVLRRQNTSVELDDDATQPRLLPNTILKALGLASKQSKDACSMNPQEIEDKYNALASALKLDKHTLEKRVELMQHQRNQSEDSIHRELTAIQQCLTTLQSQCEHDSTSKECIARLQKQADDLKNMSVWLAGRAERLGAVQEEGRLSSAAEIMVLHVDNLRRMFETEHAELEEARKLLQENRAFLRGSVSPGSFSLDDPDSRLGNRRFSIAPSSKKQKSSLKIRVGTFDHSGIEKHEELTNRRRASVAVLGFAGSQLATSTPSSAPQSVSGPHIRTRSAPPQNTFSAIVRSARFVQQAAGSFTGIGRRKSVTLNGSLNLEDFKEGKSRWNLINKARLGSSLPRQSTTDGSSSQPSATDGEESPASPQSLTIRLPDSPGNTPTATDSTKATANTGIPSPLSPGRRMTEEKSGEVKTKKDDDIYQQGYEQGVRAKVSEELGELREQQKDFRENLEQLMENAADEEEQDEKEQQQQESNAQRNFLRWPVLHNIHQRKYLRLGLAIFIFITVLLSISIQNLPENICGGPGSAYRDSPLQRLCEIVMPFTRLNHRARPPL